MMPTSLSIAQSGHTLLENADGTLAYMPERRPTLTTGTSARPDVTITKNKDIYDKESSSGDQLIFYR